MCVPDSSKYQFREKRKITVVGTEDCELAFGMSRIWISLEQMSQRTFYKGPDSKYFRLRGPHMVYVAIAHL